MSQYTCCFDKVNVNAHHRVYFITMIHLWFFDDGLDQSIAITITVVLWSAVLLAPTRNPSVLQQRLNWAAYAECRRNDPQTFKCHLRIDYESFEKLLDIIRDDLEVNPTMAALRGGAIIPELCLFCTLRYLAGGSYLDIHDRTGISRASFYRIVWKTCQAIATAPNEGDLSLKWPETVEECVTLANGFESKSHKGIIKNCIGAIDGYLLEISTPSRVEVGNVRSYYSGHYQCHGINIQVVCDHMCRFIFFAIAAPGNTNDNDAMKACGLDKKIEELGNLGYFCIIADAAYTASEQVVSIYSGADRTKAIYDNFNFFASQLRIRVEMALGLMTVKWGILCRPARCNMKNVKWQMLAIARLHNYCINRRHADADQDYDSSGGIGYYETVPMHAEDEAVYEEHLSDFPGFSSLREYMVQQVADAGLARPCSNRLRKV